MHRVDLFGLGLGQELFGDREPAWKAADVAFALILQALLFACVWWVVPRSKAVAVGLTVLLLIPGTMALNFAYLYAIPSFSDRARYDAGHFRVERRVRRRRLLARSGAPGHFAWAGAARRDVGTAGQWHAVRHLAGSRMRRRACGHTRVADCARLAPGVARWECGVRHDGARRCGTTLLAAETGIEGTEAVEVPEGQVDGGPLVSEDGGWVAWVTRSPGREASLRIEPLGSGQPILFSHPCCSARHWCRWNWI